MSLQDDVFDVFDALEKSYGEDSVEVELFNRIVQRLWEYETKSDKLEQKLIAVYKAGQVFKEIFTFLDEQEKSSKLLKLLYFIH